MQLGAATTDPTPVESDWGASDWVESDWDASDWLNMTWVHLTASATDLTG